jgi:hypothetical protein
MSLTQINPHEPLVGAVLLHKGQVWTIIQVDLHKKEIWARAGNVEAPHSQTSLSFDDLKCFVGEVWSS